MRPISFDTNEAIGDVVSFKALVDTPLRFCRNYFPEAEDTTEVEGETVTTPHEYEGSTIHVFNHDNIVADWDSTNKCSIVNCNISYSTTATAVEGQLIRTTGRRVCIARVKKDQKFVVITCRTTVTTSRVFYYREKPTFENSADVVYENPTSPGHALYNSVYDGAVITAREDGWIAFSILEQEDYDIIPAVIIRDTPISGDDLIYKIEPNEQTGTVTFDTPIEGHDVGDKPYAYYDWVTGMLTDGERFYPKQDAPFIPFILNGDYYIYFDEGVADVSYLTWNQGDRLYRFILNQEDRIPVLTDNNDNPIAGIVLEPETGFDERETPIEIPNLERKE